MADTKNVASLGPYILRVQAGELFLANDIAQSIENMYPLEEGTLRSVVGPATYVPSTTRLLPAPDWAPQVGDRPASESITDGLLQYHATPIYGKTQHGIFHTRLKNGTRDVLLLHTGDELWEFRGWNRDWRQLLGVTAPTHGRSALLPDDRAARFPTQFEPVGDGVVIVPQEARAYFYDGDNIVPLGFAEIPGAPTPRGPTDSSGSVDEESGARHVTGKGINDISYAHDGTFFSDRDYLESGMTYGFGLGNLGTVSGVRESITADAGVDFTALASNSGWLEHGEWRCKVQFVDDYGNLSALSSSSESIRFSRQPANSKIASGTGSGLPATSTINIQRRFNVDFLRKQIAWEGISTGPDHCVGRIMYRTKDLLNSGDVNYYELTPNAVPVATAFATLPDNVTRIFPDNVSDSALAVLPIEVDPVPSFKLCRTAFGRLWIGNIEGAPGMIRPSLPGRWGTFPSNTEIFPDPKGGEITGLWRSNKGLLAFTTNSTFLVQPSDDGTQFIAVPISSAVGCVAPNSIQSLPDGRVVWLGMEGFFAFDGANVLPVGEQLRKFFRKVTTGRLSQACSLYDPRSREYRCWVSTNGSMENDTCLSYDGLGWRTRTDTIARDACVTQDHRRYALIAGHTGGDTDQRYGGVYLLDNSGNDKDTTGFQEEIEERESVIETAWMEGKRSRERKTGRVVYVWLRETENSDLTVEAMRDWRNTTTETVTIKRYSSANPPTFYGATLGGQGEKLTERRPYWTRAEVYLPSAESFKFRIRGKGFWEFVGITIDEVPRKYGGAQTPP